MEDIKHSPLPWQVKNTSRDYASLLSEGQKIAEFYGGPMQRWKNAQYAEKCVMMHEDLMGLVKFMYANFHPALISNETSNIMRSLIERDSNNG